MGLMNKLFDGNEEKDIFEDNGKQFEDQYYESSKDLKVDDINGKDGSKMILLEPRAFSEAQQITDQLKRRNTVVINLKRVTSEQAKRIIDFASGSTYALKGKIEKIGSGIFLCTPNNINIQGKISSDKDDNDTYDNDDIEIDI